MRAPSLPTPTRSRALAIGSVLAVLVAASPRDARAEENPLEAIPVLRVMAGPAFHLGEAPLVQTLVDIDEGALFLVGEHMQYLFAAELGYTFDNGGMHAFNVMGAIGYGRDNLAYVAYQPRLLLGTLHDELTVGVRNAVGGHFVSDMLGVELGHQFVFTNGELTQAITATAGINVLGIFYLVLTADH